jgi:nitrogen PTS system EIIA component
MDVSKLLKPGSVRCERQASSKKHALDLLSATLAEAIGSATAGEVLEGLANRERLGSTGLGASIAVPHARIAGIDHSVAAFLKLDEPVNFDSTDGKPVDLLFGLIVPEHCEKEEIRAIRELVRWLKDPALQQELRATDDPETLHQVLIEQGERGSPSAAA